MLVHDAIMNAGRHRGGASALETLEEVDLWLAVDAPKALELQRPLPDDALTIVATGEQGGPGGRPRMTAGVMSAGQVNRGSGKGAARLRNRRTVILAALTTSLRGRRSWLMIS